MSNTEEASSISDLKKVESMTSEERAALRKKRFNSGENVSFN